MRRLLWPLLIAMPLAGCTCHNTHSTEVGVLTRRAALGGLLGKPGIQTEVYAPGATYLFPIFFTDWHTFDVSLQNLSMVRDEKKRDRSNEEELCFRCGDAIDSRV